MHCRQELTVLAALPVSRSLSSLRAIPRLHRKHRERVRGPREDGRRIRFSYSFKRQARPKGSVIERGSVSGAESDGFCSRTVEKRVRTRSSQRERDKRRNWPRTNSGGCERTARIAAVLLALPLPR